MNLVVGVKKIFDSISYICSVLSTGLIVVMMFAVVVDVIARWLKIPIYGVFELQGVLIGMTIFLGLSKAQERKEHIGVSILSQYIPKRVMHIIMILIYTLSMVFFIWITYIYGGKAVEAFLTGEVITGIVKIPLYPLKFVMTLGLGLLSIQLFIDVIKEATSLFEKNNEGPSDSPSNDEKEVPEL